MKLLKSLYGPKQATYRFNDHMDKTLISMEFTRLRCNSSVYIGFRNESKIIATIYADDFLILKAEISNIFKRCAKSIQTYAFIG